MAYPVSQNSVCQLTYKGTLFNQVVMNTFHYRLEQSGGIVADGAAFLDDFFEVLNIPDGFNTLLMKTWSQAIVNVTVDMQWIDVDRFVKKEQVVVGAGNAAWVTAVTNLAATIELRGDMADKRGRGIKHLPGIGGTAVNAGKLEPAVVAAVRNFGEIAIIPVVVAQRTMNPIIFGRARPGYTKPDGTVMPPLPKSYRPITAFSVPDTVRVMRRRTVGVGI